jgi:hypothetical protein
MMNLEAAPRSLRHVSVALALLVGGCATSGVTGTSQDELEGELEVLEFSYVVTSETEYVLRTDDGDLWTLDFGGEPILVTGDRIRARGHQVDDHFVVDDYATTRARSPRRSSATRSAGPHASRSCW